jgi:uncharacterized membrane protein HdeD (DUF308 family)
MTGAWDDHDRSVTMRGGIRVRRWAFVLGLPSAVVGLLLLVAHATATSTAVGAILVLAGAVGAVFGARGLRGKSPRSRE